MSDKRYVTIGILGATGVALGALGAHFLKAKMQMGLITADHLDGFEKAVKYQMYHTIAMFLITLKAKENFNKYFGWAYALFFWGIILFSGSLYFLCTRNLFGADWLKVLGPVTPLGGICFILGWLFISFSVLKKEKA
jgi:uncharacterized membrane protein YgdD (TMEM256/DUF423 family)